MKALPIILPKVVEHRLRVRYSETDSMGIVYHANYIVWFEIGRTEFCRAAGMPYRKMEEDGILILVTEVECKYRRSARYDDEIVTRTRMGQVGSRGLSFYYEILRATDETLLAEGSTRHVFADSSNRLSRVPEPVRKTFLEFASG